MSPFFNSSLAIVFLICGVAVPFIMLELRGAPSMENEISRHIESDEKLIRQINQLAETL